MAESAIEDGKTILILSDLGVDDRHAPIPSLLADWRGSPSPGPGR
jgi:hypothetical protein